MTSVCVWTSTWLCMVSLSSHDWALVHVSVSGVGTKTREGVCQEARGILSILLEDTGQRTPPGHTGLPAHTPGPKPGLCFLALSFLEGTQNQSWG